MSDPGARHTDPLGSHEAVANLFRWTNLRDAIMIAAQTFDPIPFDDGDLTEQINLMWTNGVQRNVVARSRGILEREGQLVRIGNRRRDGKATMHFRLPDNETRAAHPAPPVPLPESARAEYTEVQGYAWCTTHQQTWTEGEHGCDACGIYYNSQDPDDPCVEVPLFIHKT